jgi:hypothetical protein
MTGAIAGVFASPSLNLVLTGLLDCCVSDPLLSDSLGVILKPHPPPPLHFVAEGESESRKEKLRVKLHIAKIMVHKCNKDDLEAPLPRSGEGIGG